MWWQFVCPLPAYPTATEPFCLLFLPAIELEGLGALSDAPVRRRRHDRHAVVEDEKLLPAGAEAEVGAYLGRWRRTVVDHMLRSIRARQEDRGERFGEKPHLYRKSNEQSPVRSDNDLDPDENSEIRAHDFEQLVDMGLARLTQPGSVTKECWAPWSPLKE